MAQMWHAEPSIHLSSDAWASRRTPNFLDRGRSSFAPQRLDQNRRPRGQVSRTPQVVLGSAVTAVLAARRSKVLQVARRAGWAQQPRLPRIRTDPEESETNFGRNIFLSTAFLLSSGANKVLLRILLVNVHKYAFMLGVLTNLLYITVFGLQFRYELKTAGEQDDESQADSLKFALNGRGLRLLAGAGACEAAAFVGLPLCASQLPGSLLPVMSQGLLIFSMLFSWWILGKRYDLLQVLGVVVVATGVGICTWPNLTADFSDDPVKAFGIYWAIGLFVSYGFISFSLVLKELAFVRFKQWRRENGHKKGDLNLEMVNFATALWQGWALMLLWPVNFAVLTKLDTATYFRAAFKHFHQAGVWLVAYLGVNLVYTEVTTIVLKQLSAVIFLLVNVLNVPLVSLFFCLKLPLLGAAPFRWSFVAGLVVIIGGLLTYNHKTLTAWRGSNDN
mmetsp:Transcript_21892/g.45574  ORF Transcript_21892/g.45574 Transcript_21892/m.45574 type:complete len:447 (+) Transcript_21892:55-1395(+)